jgi:hypothetical protein
MIMYIKKLFKRENKRVVWLKVPTDLTTRAERDRLMEATTDKLEHIIYKSF